MNDRREEFRHDRSPYERPMLDWRCGRTASWAQPCASGPGPDGKCPHRQAPCVPRPAHRRTRGRLAFLVAALMAALIVLLGGDAGQSLGLPSAVDAGPLSAVHASVTAESGCSSCHVAHGRGASAWLAAAWRTLQPAAGPALDQACASCHGFAGRETLAHNASPRQGQASPPTTCLGCHSEHLGTATPQVNEDTCRSCHEREAHGFPSGHPPFRPGFPHASAGPARFDHASHIGKHFTDPRQTARVPAGGCQGCHAAPPDGGRMSTASYDKSCAGCHDAGIARRDLLLMRWPELPPLAGSAKQCGPGTKKVLGDPVSLDPPNTLLAWLLGVPTDDPASYAEPLRRLAAGMIDEGAAAIPAASGGRLGNHGDTLLRGLAGETARLAACAWTSNREYEAPVGTPAAGWQAQALEIRYARPGHADPVLRSWLDTIAGATTPVDVDEAARLEAVRAEFLTADGPGQCIKCHAVARSADGSRRIEWGSSPVSARPLHRFDHRPHVHTSVNGDSCGTCHKVAGPQSDLPRKTPVAAAGDGTARERGAHGETGLTPIARDTCASCHRPGAAGQSCLTCHAYHQNHAIKPRESRHVR